MTTERSGDSTAIIDAAYPEVESKIKSSLSSYKRYLSSFITARANQLYSNIPSQQILFTEKDEKDFFAATRIDKNKIKDAIKHTYYWNISAFNPRYAKDECTVSLLCLVRYFNAHKMQKELELTLLNMTLSGKYYPSIFYGAYKTVYPKDYIMEYVVTHMCTNKYDIVKYGNLIGCLKSISSTWLKAYPERFKEFDDDDVQYLIEQLHNRIYSFVHNLSSLYFDAYKNKDRYITYDSDDVSENNYHLADNDAFKLERAVTNTMTIFDSHGIDPKICKMASNDYVKFDELKSILENILGDNKNIAMVKEYITLLIVTYFKQSKDKNKSVTDIDFISYSISPKPNSRDEYYLRQKELITSMLMNNSEHFARRRNRQATELAYYRAINAYFALIIQKANK